MIFNFPADAHLVQSCIQQCALLSSRPMSGGEGGDGKMLVEIVAKEASRRVIG